MVASQRQKTAFGGSAAGLLSARLPGFPPGAGEPLTTKCFLAVKKPGSTSP